MYVAFVTPFPATTGFTRTDDMVGALDGHHVGLASCLGLYIDKTTIFEVQCCSTKPGRCGLIMTGGLSDVSQDSIRMLKGLVDASAPEIAPRVGLSEDGLHLMRREYDLHVHLENAFAPLRGSYQMGPIYMALVSLMIGRRIRKGTMLFGAVGNLGEFYGAWQLEVLDIQHLQGLVSHRDFT